MRCLPSWKCLECEISGFRVWGLEFSIYTSEFVGQNSSSGCGIKDFIEGLELTFSRTNMETHLLPFIGTVVFIGPFLGFPC